MINHLNSFIKGFKLLALLLLLTNADLLHAQCSNANAGPDLLNNDVTSVKLNASLPDGYDCSWSIVFDETNEEFAYGVTPDAIHMPFCFNNNAIFTGKPGDSYQLIMNYDSSGTCSSKDTVEISFSKDAVPVAIAGEDISDTNSLYINLYANIPAYKTYGKWNVIQGQGARIFDRFSPYSQFKGKAGEEYKLVWEVHNGTELAYDTMLVSFNSNAKLGSIPGLTYEHISPSSENFWPNEKIRVRFVGIYMPYENFTFTSSDTNVAKILNNYQVLLKAAGDAQLILTSVDNPLLADTLPITVQTVEANGGSDVIDAPTNYVTLNGTKPYTYSVLWSILEGTNGELLNSDS
ncbi:MAG: hypothetical protein MI892_30815, partial [Desulfobacterales bacterium]|nr:hypothetical protein [Desulfobacterales bacterium]